jgi:hypothetical protein
MERQAPHDTRSSERDAKGTNDLIVGIKEDDRTERTSGMPQHYEVRLEPGTRADTFLLTAGPRARSRIAIAA